MKILTKRCMIRPFEEKDLDSFIIYRNNPSWMEFQGFKGLTKEEYRTQLLHTPQLNNGLQLAIIERITNNLIGDIYLKQEGNIVWFGYTITPLKARQGFAFEVGTAALIWVKKQGYQGVNAAVIPQNTPSVQLLKKLKFQYTSTDSYGEDIYTYLF